MFPSKRNLDEAISDYIDLVGKQGCFTQSDAAELAAHLYDSTDILKHSGLSEEEAFLVACRRLGETEILNKEYAKVNTSVSVNNLWAYLFVGFNLFFSLPSLIIKGLETSFFWVNVLFYDSLTAIVIITGFNIFICMGIWLIVKQKRQIAAFIEAKVFGNAKRTVCLSFVPLTLFFISNFATTRLKLHSLIFYSLHVFNSRFVEFSFYMVILTIIGGIVVLVFSINRFEKISLKSMFEMPSTYFLLLISVLAELVAASTRILQFENTLTSLLAFGLIYMLGAYFITVYNMRNNYRYLITFSIFGIISETVFGIMADIERGNTFFSAYFILTLITAVITGLFFGRGGLMMCSQNQTSKGY